MPVPSPSCLFDAGLRNTSSPSEGMKSITQRQLNLFSKRFKMNTPHSTSDSEDVVGDLGEYFTGTAAMWARLTHQLINGPHINEAAVKACERSKALSHMSDLGEIAKIDVDLSILRHVLLNNLPAHTNIYIYILMHDYVYKIELTALVPWLSRQICDLSETFARQVQDIWQPQTSLANRGGQDVMPTYISQSCDTNMSSVSEAMSLNSEEDSTHSGSRKLLPDQSQMSHASLKCGDMSGPEDSSDDDEQFASIDMEALRQRGRGSYLCPKGLKCDKGGVDKDGNLVFFDWNSSFAYVPRAQPIAVLRSFFFFAVKKYPD